MPIPDVHHAIIEKDKLCAYLLNRRHPEGGSKAAWFATLGYKASEWESLAEDLRRVARDCDAFEQETTPFGIKFKAVGVIGMPGHRPGTVVTVWISEQQRPPRLITAYPSKP